jgi:hypothetical protein
MSMPGAGKLLQSACFVPLLVLLSCGGSHEPARVLPEDGTDTVHVSVTDTLGLFYGDSCRVFGTITQASLGPEGCLYVLDGQLGRLSIFSPELGFIRHVGRPGSGPGEFLYPQSFAFLEDGRLAVCDWGAGSVVFFDSSYRYLETLSGYYPDSPRYIQSGPGNSFVAMNISLSQDDGEFSGSSHIARFSEGIEPEHVYDSWPLMITVYGDPDDPDLSIGRVDQDFDTDLEGTVYLAERDDSTYLVEVFFADGSADTLVSRQWERVEKSRERMEEEVYEEGRQAGNTVNRMNRRAFQDVYPYLNGIGSVDVGPDGNIWVGQGYTEVPTFEVFTPAGEFLFVAVIPELEGVRGLEYSFGNGYLAYDRQPADYPKVYLLMPGTCPE